VGFIEKFLGGWLTKQLDRLVKFIWSKFQSWDKGNKHLKDVEKYIKAINLITAKAQAEATESGRVTNATELELKQMLERRNRDIKFDDNWMQKYPWD
jgi:hypothetical protein